MARFVAPVADRITQQFGENPDYYRPLGQLGHTGIDYGCPMGTAIRATGDGRVSFVGPGANHGGFLSVAGNAILLDHGDIYSAYSHLSRFAVTQGQQVTQGQIIGYSGNTGQVTGPHLHFEFWGKPTNWKNGWSGRVDPSAYLNNEGGDEEMQPTTYEVANIYAQALLFRDMSREEWKQFHEGKSRNKLFDEFNSSGERRDRLVEFTTAISDSSASKSDRAGMAAALEQARIAQEEMEKIVRKKEEMEVRNHELESERNADKEAGESILRRLGQFVSKYIPGLK
ncbi:M23 family metallopeptidase [Rhodococcus qingshengii]|uniref:M23 family metallopeptidase n=1 Tax=Rhodococcus TaxID=1827 RepID=UPI000F6170E5|nr:MULTISPECIES: M23 family metallopeptidase [Rhodococcus]AZI61878.1 M23 family metallopeptidase [Rhodococcus sp. NJ-530]BDQ20085.1 M23 family metallopeptidase [Rhodococcus qingshengii]